MKTLIPFYVSLQALGGKFLGPNAYETEKIKIWLDIAGEIHPVNYSLYFEENGKKVEKNDGSIQPDFMTGMTSFMPVLTMPASGTGNPTVNYLVQVVNTIVGTAEITLPDNNQFGHIVAHIPTPSGSSLELRQTVILNPNVTSYRINMVVPGLLLTENKNTVVPPGIVSVFVNMMCGCKITEGLSTSFWTVSDFEVYARVHFNGNKSDVYPMVFDTQTNNSLYILPIRSYSDITHVDFWAYQKSTGNYGTWQQKF